MSTTRPLLTPGEAGDILRMSTAHVLRLVKNDEIPYIVLPNGEVRFIEADLWAWIERRRMPGWKP